MVKESRIDRRISSDVVNREDKYWKRILIVDDETDITTTFKLIIENASKTGSRRIVVDTFD